MRRVGVGGWRDGGVLLPRIASSAWDSHSHLPSCGLLHCELPAAGLARRKEFAKAVTCLGRHKDLDLDRTGSCYGDRARTSQVNRVESAILDFLISIEDTELGSVRVPEGEVCGTGLGWRHK